MTKLLTTSLFMASLLGTVAEATVLTFDGNICATSTGTGPCGNYSQLGQDYGDISGQLNVTYTSRVSAGNSASDRYGIRWWGPGYGDLVNVVWGGSTDTSGVAEIALIPAPGFQVRLNSFDLGSYNGTSRISQYTIYDSAYNRLLSSGSITVPGTGHSHFPINLVNTQGLIIQWGPSGYNVGIDNVDFTVEPAGTGGGQPGITGELEFDYAKIKAVTANATAPGLLTLPTCLTRANLFSPTTITCAASATVCTLEANLTAEISDGTPGNDSVRYYFTVDGVTTGVFPNTNFGVNSTTKTNQTESATASWVHNALTPGDHTVVVKGCVADTTRDGVATAVAGDRVLTMRLYRGN